ncbi:MAG: tyrosine-type recombinase/integrase [Phycisphaerales bacterium]
MRDDDDSPPAAPAAGAYPTSLIARDAAGRVILEITLAPGESRGTVPGMSAPVATFGGPQGREPVSSLRIDASAPTVAALLDDFEAAKRIAGITDGHVDDCVGGVRSAATAMGWVFPSQITEADIVRWLEQCRARSLSPKYRNDIRGYLLQFTAFLEARHVIAAVNPKAVPRARVPRTRARYCPSRDEMVALIIAASLDWRKRDRWLLYLVAATTGCRMRTLGLLRWEHLHHEDGRAWLELPAEIVKNRCDSHVWLTREAFERLDRYRQAGGGREGFVFDRVPKLDSFNRDLKTAGLTKKGGARGTFSRHSLRHFASRYLASADAFDLRERQAQMGHRSAEMTRRTYAHADHAALGEKIWNLQPLLPPEFTGNRGRRSLGKWPLGLDKGGPSGRKCGATFARAHANPQDSIRNPPVARERPNVAVWHDRIPGGFRRESADPGDPWVGPTAGAIVVGGSNPPTPIAVDRKTSAGVGAFGVHEQIHLVTLSRALRSGSEPRPRTAAPKTRSARRDGNGCGAVI